MRIEQGPTDAHKQAQSPQCDPQLMDLLGVPPPSTLTNQSAQSREQALPASQPVSEKAPGLHDHRQDCGASGGTGANGERDAVRGPPGDTSGLFTMSFGRASMPAA